MNSLGCPWKRRTLANHNRELDLIDRITIGRSVHERLQPYNTDSSINELSIQKSVNMLLDYGVVIIRDLLAPHDIDPWGKAALQNLDDAIAELKLRDIDLLNPGSCGNEPLSNHELAMREDLRLDLRNGRNFRKMREDKGVQSIRMRPAIVKIGKHLHNSNRVNSNCFDIHLIYFDFDFKHLARRVNIIEETMDASTFKEADQMDHPCH